jgi:hypothetical protein
MIATVSFDPETLILLREAVDRAWGSLSLSRRTAQAKDSMARAVVQSATLGERDIERLCAYAVAIAGRRGTHATL